ncbi:MAG: acyl-CoA desaturase [Chlamydiales bacterium]
MNKSFDWRISLFLISYQLLLIFSLPFYFYYMQPSAVLIVLSIILLFITGISVTGGYHRYFSHRTYKAHPLIESLLLFFGGMAMEGSALRWAYEHRLHHAYVDTEKDPYSIKKGFLYAHFLWMLEKARPIEEKLVSDLIKNPRVMFQDKLIFFFMFGTNFLVWIVMGWLLNDYIGSFFIAVALRIFILHHLTWFINSLAHTWGNKPFCQEQTAVNNLILSFLTFGEGYHNYHHVFPKDYRNGVKWYHFDPTKWIIWILSKLKLVRDLKQVDQLTIKKRMVIERKALLLKKIHNIDYVRQEELTSQVEIIASKILEKIMNFTHLYKELDKFKQPAITSKIHYELYCLHASLKEDWKQWKLLSREILNT